MISSTLLFSWTTHILIYVVFPSPHCPSPRSKKFRPFRQDDVLDIFPSPVPSQSSIVSSIMKLLSKTSSRTANKLAFLGAQAFLSGSICRYLDSAAGFSPVSSVGSGSTNHFSAMANVNSNGSNDPIPAVARNSGRSSRLFSTMDGPQLMNVDKEQMEEIIEDYEQGGREESGYVVMDVREENEVAASGKVSPNTHTLPLSAIGSMQVFEMDPDEFEEVCGFPKPTADETLVFTCAAGIRSKNACAYAAQAGYTQLVNYMGGAYEWFAN